MIAKLNFNKQVSFKFLVCSQVLGEEACDDFKTTRKEFLIGVLLHLLTVRHLNLTADRIHLRLKGN